MLPWLGDCLSELFYGGETDLVVNTPSMSGGLARSEGILLKPVAGPEVHHLSYFKRAESADALLAALGGDDAGYERPELWSERGWAHRQSADLTAPQFWERDTSGRWWRRRFGTMVPLRPEQPVVHVCFFEAEAYARWAGKRLPTEAEWEKAARHDPVSGRSRRFPWGDEDPTDALTNLGQRHLEPADIGAYPLGASPAGVQQLIGDVWEWTSSGFEAYPGFEVFPYDEYSKVFFGGDYKMLRGGSFGTDPVACRGTFRNWDHPIRRQIFSGFRCARDVSVEHGGRG